MKAICNQQNSKLNIVKTQDILIDFNIEEDDSPIKKSISEIVLDDTLMDNRIKKIDIYGDVNEYDSGVICGALGFHLKNGQFIFIDPTFYF